MDVDKFSEFIKKKNETVLKTFPHYAQKEYRTMNLRHFIYKKKSEAKMVNDIIDTFGKDVVLLYGNWSRSTQMKHTSPVPGLGLRRLLSLILTCILTNEFRTSCRCYACGKELKNMKNSKGKSIYRCLICDECCSLKNGDIKVRRIMNRDIVGAKNILKLGTLDLQKIERPKEFKREGVKKRKAE
jgi:hypothetical protein